jgi:hypothetical protein
MSELDLRKTQRELIARAIGYGLSQPDMKLMDAIYEHALSTVCDALVTAGMVTEGHSTGLKTDLRAKQAQLHKLTVINVATEIAHSMNRKALLDNDGVEPFIKLILEEANSA